jgi:hypothetical protein
VRLIQVAFPGPRAMFRDSPGSGVRSARRWSSRPWRCRSSSLEPLGRHDERLHGGADGPPQRAAGGRLRRCEKASTWGERPPSPGAGREVPGPVCVAAGRPSSPIGRAVKRCASRRVLDIAVTHHGRKRERRSPSAEIGIHPILLTTWPGVCPHQPATVSRQGSIDLSHGRHTWFGVRAARLPRVRDSAITRRRRRQDPQAAGAVDSHEPIRDAELGVGVLQVLADRARTDPPTACDRVSGEPA